MKTRIILEEKCGKTIYKVQYKFLFWWFTEKMYDLFDGSYYMTFTTLTEAQDYICRHYTKSITKVVWENY